MYMYAPTIMHAVRPHLHVYVYVQVCMYMYAATIMHAVRPHLFFTHVRTRMY